MALEGNSVVPIVELTDLERYDKKREERAVRRQQLEVGTPFRPYDLFDQVLVIPAVLIAKPDLSPGEKLTWMALASALGRSGDCYPSCATLGRKLGVERKQVRRWLDGLVSKRFVRRTARPPEAGGDWDTNLYELLWHPIFGNSSVDGWGQIAPTRGDKLSPGGGGKSSHKKNHHHQKEKIEKKKEQGSPKPERKSAASAEIKTGGRKPFNSFPDDDDGKPKREPLEEPQDELRLRFQERFRDDSGAILQTILADLSYDRQALADFVAFDDAHTGAPERLKNPGGYYRALVKEFRTARRARIEAEQRERYREYERSLSPQEPEEKRVCELRLCAGGGELFENGKYRPCDCAAGQKLSPKVQEIMEVLNRGAA